MALVPSPNVAFSCWERPSTVGGGGGVVGVQTRGVGPPGSHTCGSVGKVSKKHLLATRSDFLSFYPISKLPCWHTARAVTSHGLLDSELLLKRWRDTRLG